MQLFISKYLLLMNKYTNADKKGQAILVDQLEKIFNGYTVDINQHYIDKATVDLDMNVTSSDGNTYEYSIETKDRQYNHTSFGGEWLIEEHKVLELKNKKGKALYANTYADNWLCIWDLNKLDFNTLRSEYRWLPKSTVEVQKGKSWKKVYYLPISKAVYSSSFI